MYWVTNTEDNKITVSYFEIVNKSVMFRPFYNPFTKLTQYPQNKELVVKSKIVDSLEEFAIWYSLNKNI